MRLAQYGFLRFFAVELQYEYTWLLQAVTDKDLVTTKKTVYLLTDPQIIRFFSEDNIENK